MTVTLKTPEQIAELKQLQSQLPLALKRATEALRTYGKPLEGKLLQRAEAAEANVSRIKQKISALST
jgi:hypothetical protein